MTTCTPRAGTYPNLPRAAKSTPKPEIDRRPGNRVNSVPLHDNHWYGHNRPKDKRYVIAHPYPHGRFEHFEIASWDWELAASWRWDCRGSNFVVYHAPDHPGWYLAQTGVYVRAQYMGS